MDRFVRLMRAQTSVVARICGCAAGFTEAWSGVQWEGKESGPRRWKPSEA
jgi:hypothetical protein